MANGNDSNLAFQPEGAVLEEEFNPAGAVLVRTDDELKAEWGSKGLLGRLKLLATDPDIRGKFTEGLGKVGGSFVKNYDASVEEAFTPSESQPTIPRIEGMPDIPVMGTANPQAIAGAVNTATGVANTVLTPGFVSMMNPIALAYALPFFARQAGGATADFVGKLEDKDASTQDVVESGLNAGLSIAGAVAPGFVGVKAARRFGGKAPKEPIAEFKPVAEDNPVATLARAADDLAPEAALDASLPAAKPITTADIPAAARLPDTKADFTRYQEIQKQWKELREKGVEPDSPEIQALWRENEEIKNRHQGMPPVEPVDIGPRDRTVSTGEGMATATEEAMLREQKRLVDEYLAQQKQSAAPPTSEAMAGTPEAPAPGGAAPEPMGVLPPGAAQVGEFIDRASFALSDLKEGGIRAFNEIREIPEFTPHKQAVNEWFGSRQINSLAVREMAEKLNREIPDKLGRDAITNYIQAAGDRATLEQWRDASTVASLKDGYSRALRLTPEEVAVAERIRTFYDTKLTQAQEWGIIDEGIPNYVNQIWKEQLLGTPPQVSEFGGRLTQQFRSAKQRTFENFFEGEQAQYRPATKDISQLTALYADGLNKAIATKKLVKDLTEKTASDGRPLAAPIGSASIIKEGAPATDPLFIRPRSKGEEVADYRAVDNPALYKWKWVGEENGKPIMLQGQLGFHPEIHAKMRDMLGRSAIREWYDKPSGPLKGIVKGTVKALDRGGQMFKGMSLGFLSPFHQVQEATHAVGHKINPFTNLPALTPDNPVLQRGVKHGLALAGERDAMQHFAEGLGGAAHNNPLWRLPVVGKWAQDYSTWLFHDYIPKLKLKTYEAIEQRNTARYTDELARGEVTPDQVQYLSAQQTNAAYGHLNYADIGRNPTLQHILQLTLLAPDFLEARGRFTGQAVKGLVSKSGREQLTAIATLAATFWITARVLNKTLDDDYHWEHPFSVMHDGREYMMRSVPEDIFKLFQDSRRFINNRLSPLIGRGTMEFITGRNYRGEKITFSQEVRDLATRWVPINMQNNPLVKKLGGSEGASPIKWWEQFLSSSGLQIRRISDINNAYQLASDWKEFTGRPRDTGTYPVSKYQQLRYALEDGDIKLAREEIDKLSKETPKAKVVDGFHQSLMRPFTGSARDEVAFIASLDEKEKQMVRDAYAQRTRMWRDFVRAFGPAGAAPITVDDIPQEARVP